MCDIHGLHSGGSEYDVIWVYIRCDLDNGAVKLWIYVCKEF
jgi:hypothetical protein